MRHVGVKPSRQRLELIKQIVDKRLDIQRIYIRQAGKSVSENGNAFDTNRITETYYSVKNDVV